MLHYLGQMILCYCVSLGAEATYNEFEGSPLLPDLMCNGTEYFLSDCPGYILRDIPEGSCENQASVRCVEGTVYLSSFEFTSNSYVHNYYSHFSQCPFLALMGIFKLPMGHMVTMTTTTMVAEWRCASMKSTTQCATWAGMIWRLLLYATILAIRDHLIVC